MEKKYESEALMVCHQSAESLYRLGIITAEEMREYDEGCLVKEPETDYQTEPSPAIDFSSPAPTML